MLKHCLRSPLLWSTLLLSIVPLSGAVASTLASSTSPYTMPAISDWMPLPYPNRQSFCPGRYYTLWACVCVLPGSFRGMGAFYFKIKSRRDILNTTLMTRITTHKQSLTMGGLKHKHHIQLLGTMQMNRQQPIKIVQLFVVKIVLCRWHRMTREVDGHSDPCMQSIARPTHLCWNLRCNQMRTPRWKVG